MAKLSAHGFQRALGEQHGGQLEGSSEVQVDLEGQLEGPILGHVNYQKQGPGIFKPYGFRSQGIYTPRYL